MNAKVGDGATLHYPSDRYPYVVTAVSPSGNKITIEPLNTGLVPVDRNFIARHTFTAEELKDLSLRLGGSRTAHYSKKSGAYMVGGSTPVTVGTAYYYRNYMD